MREIKFRAWDIQAEEILYGVEHTYDGYKVPMPSFGALLDCPDFYIVMQYTGLKDKNGKEIYEGDIVSLKYLYDKRTTDKGQVVWREDKASFGLKSLKGLTNEVYELYQVTAEHNLEIIGNIYENPELLKG